MKFIDYENIAWFVDEFCVDDSLIKIKSFFGICSICAIIIVSFLISLIFPKKIRLYAFLGVAFISFGFIYYELCPSVNEYDIHVGLKEPIKMVQLTDLHENTTFNWVINKSISICNKENPDIVVLTGDYKTSIGKGQLSPKLIKKLEKIKCKKKYSVFGNHDRFKSQKEIEKQFKEIGITPVEYKLIKLEDNIYLTGLNVRNGVYEVKKEKFRLYKILKKDPMNIVLEKYISSLPKNSKYIFLLHEPNVITLQYYREDLFKKNKFFFITGHTHGGQIILPKQDKKQIARNEFGMDYLDGAHEVLEQKLFISKGVGSSYIPFRLNAKPEVTVYNID